MSKQILVNASHYETRVAILEDGEIRNLHIEREEDRNVVGNIYKGVVKRVLPGMQAAFLELGLERTAFLYVDDIILDSFGTDVDLLDDSEPESSDSVSEEEVREWERERASQGQEQGEEEDVPPPPTVSVEASLVSEASPAAVVTEEPRGSEDADAIRGDFDREPDEEWEEGVTEEDEGEEPEGEAEPEIEEQSEEEAAGRPSHERSPEPEENRGVPRETERRGERQAREPRDREGGREARDRDRDRGRRGGRGPRRGRGGRRGFRSRRQRPSQNIQDLLKEGQEVLVQVAKAPIGTKGARLTTHISLPGRNLVLMPTVKHLGISRRIQSDRERRRLRDIFLKRLRPKNVGFIIRTVADGKSFKELAADADYLLSTWEKIKRESAKKRAPALIHEDLSLAMRAVRDFFTDEVDSFIIDNSEEYERCLQFIGQFMPRLKGRVKLFKGPSQLFEHYGIEAEISRALGKKVWLKSGGYLLIDQSEALTAIDVNTGRYVGSKSLEETILKTNLEAVKEVAYQLRIRNVGGIIIIDLIDMESAENREKVYRALQEALGEDKAKTNILKISDLGLVEMTRKRTHEDLVRYLTESCNYCEGRGYHKSKRTVCFEIFREIEKEALTHMKNIVVFANPQVVNRLVKEEREHIDKLEARFTKRIAVKADPAFHVEQFEVFAKQ